MILTPEEFRQHVTTVLEDAALQRLLDAAEAAIVEYAGPGDSMVELFGDPRHPYEHGDGRRRNVILQFPAASITSITETIWSTVTTLATDDYLIHPNRYTIERLVDGTNPRFRWMGRVTVTYVPAGQAALRIGAQIDLVTLSINATPGSRSEQIGSWTEQYATSAEAESARADILSGLRQPSVRFVVR